MAEIQSRAALQPRQAKAPLASRMVASADSWNVQDVICTAGPNDPAFEERHSDFTVAIVLSGTFQYRSEATELMTPGSLFLGNAGQEFECGHEHATGDRCLSFRFGSEYFENITAETGLSGKRAFGAQRLPPLRELSSVVARARAGLANGSDLFWEELGIELAAAAARLANGTGRDVRSAPPSAIARVTRAVRMVEHGEASELTIRALAREARLSPYHFLRVFESVAGLTPYQYVRRIRLREAAVRLAAGREKVLDIALDCGFGSVSNFNRAFREEFGVAPLGFRRG